MTDLKSKLQEGTYRVDPGLVAGSLLAKLVLAGRVRRRLESDVRAQPYGARS